MRAYCDVLPGLISTKYKVVILKPEYDKAGLPVPASLMANFDVVTNLMRSGKAVAVYTPTFGGVAEAIMKMSFGNDIGFAYNNAVSMKDIFGYAYGSFIIELTSDENIGEVLGMTTEANEITYNGKTVSGEKLLAIYENKLESVYACNIPSKQGEITTYNYTDGCKAKAPAIKVAKPHVLIPVFPGTNCEYDTAKAFADAGADPEIFVINNLTAAGISASAENFAKKIADSQIIFVPGGFSGGDEPDGSGKFITAFFRNATVKEATTSIT